MKYFLISIVHVISTCTATKILYVLPDNVSDVHCPSQPCATLGQYLLQLDNGSLPVLSNVEYYFLPGEHSVVHYIFMMHASNFSLIGFGLSPSKLVCWPQSSVTIFDSYNVTIRNLEFCQCNSDLFPHFGLDIAAGLVLSECYYCKVEDIYFFGYGFAGINLFLNSYINNVIINMTIEKPAVQMCSPKFFVLFVNTKYDHDHNLLSIKKIFIKGYNEICYKYRTAMAFRLYQNHYGMKVELCNSQFYDMDQIALYIRMEYGGSSLLIKNCTFLSINHTMTYIDKVVKGEIASNNASVWFENCAFYYNAAAILVEVRFILHNNLCTHSSDIIIRNCNFEFIESESIVLLFSNYVLDCEVNIIFNGNVYFANNDVASLMYFSQVSVYMNGLITILENIVEHNIIEFNICNVVFTKIITFISNICFSAIYLRTHKIPYMFIMEYTNIMFVNTTIQYQTIVIEVTINNNNGIFPHCIFQYMVSSNYKYDASELIGLYNISFSGSKLRKQTSFYILNAQAQMVGVNNFLTHCKWLPTAVFNGHSPGYINQQIIQVDGHQWIHHKEICYCPHDGDYNCTVDLLGPVYPGQMLQVDLCIPQADKKHSVYAETHAITLPNSACKLAHQTEFISSIGNESKTFNFTIISEAYKACELFLTSLQFIQTAFYVQLLQCPVGFTLQNGKCDCDPFLPPDIDTCYIDLSAIRHPANTWITAHTITNNTTNYLMSDCPMDYCLPYSTNINLAHPDLQCQFNRTGILCSQCQHPLSMVFASSRCMKCTNVHILITIIVIVAGIVLVVLLYVLNLTVTIGTINGIIFYANIVSINDSVFLVNGNVFKPLRVFISFTNLDLGIETCFYNGMDSYAKMWLQLFFPTYLIIIAISIIIASRYSSRMLRLTYSRSLPVLATLFLLSYTGVLRVVLTVLFSYSTISDYPSNDKEMVWSIDASVPLFGIKFTILFITCLVLFLLLIPFNVTLLFTRYFLRFRVVNHFKPLLDAFQGSYKDRFYYWIAVHILFKSAFFSLYAFQVKLRLILATIVLVIFTGYYGYLQPNKYKIINFQELSMLVNLTIMYAVSVKDNGKIFSFVTNFMMSLALMQFCIIVLCHFFFFTCHCKFAIKEKLVMFLNKKKSNNCSFDVALLNIPERTYNYSEYQDGLVSDDFQNRN